MTLSYAYDRLTLVDKNAHDFAIDNFGNARPVPNDIYVGADEFDHLQFALGEKEAFILVFAGPASNS